MSQIQQAKQFKIAVKSPKWLQESLDWKKSPISNLTLKIDSVVFKICTSLQCFQQEVLEFDIIWFIRPEENSKKAAKNP